jgi:uncharacterized protein YbjT (DUF2867 family)
MVGGEVLRLALDHPGIGEVVAVARRSTGITHKKLKEVIHTDFLKWDSIGDALKGYDAAFYCIGAYTGTLPEGKFEEVLAGYCTAFSAALYERSPGAAFCFLSGAGADQSMKSRTNFARFLGMAENALLHLGFPRVAIFRPGYIYPIQPRKEPNIMYRISRSVYPVVSRIYPNIGLTSAELARAMLAVGLDPDVWQGGPVLANRDIKSVAGKHQAL